MNKIYSLLLLLLVSFSAIAQRDTIQLAEDLIYNQDFDGAIVFYRRIIKMDPKNPDHYYKLGFCYLNTPEKRDSAVAPLRTAVDLYENTPKKKRKHFTTSPDEIKFYLARAYRVNHEFDSALFILDELKASTKNKKILEIIENEEKLCKDSKELFATPKKVEVINLGPIINTQYTEHTPVFSPDESELIFTSRKKLFPDAQKDVYGEYDENIYISIKDSLGNWTEPQPLSLINTHDHEATISLSYDGSKLFIYKAEDDGSIFYSEFKGDHWGAPLKLGENINTKYRETHASLSYDGTTLFFTSDRPGGYGGLDIYVSKKLPDGTWGEAQNIGPGINTDKDEESPYILPDGKTLYFSSKGHGGLGGYDIFKTHLNEFGTWTKPENLGYPINSIDDDVFYFPTPDEKRAYFASKKGKGYGSSDIYLMKLPEAKGSDLVVLTGMLTVCEGELPQADVLITDNESGDYYIAMPKNGKFVFVTHRGGIYNVMVDVNNKTVFNEDFTVPQDAPNIMMYKAIRLDPEVPCQNEVTMTDEDLIDPKRIGPDGTIYDTYVEIENILFPLNQVGNIKPNKTLDTLVSFLKRNPEAVIEVGGYCDASGRAAYNYQLGLKRAQAVKNYLISKGVADNQVLAVSYGEENPIAININPDGTWNKQGQQFNRRVEFRLRKQGEETLLIWGMKIPPELKNPNYKFNYKKAETNIEIMN